jgi:Na+/H+-dicarboxylate symporter
MDFASQVQVGVTGALICCGAAPIPGGFIVFIWMIINLADVPAHVDMEQLQSSLSVLLAINWFMDRCRTTENIVGDSVVAGIVEYKIYGPRAFEGAKPTLDPLGSPMPKAEGQLEHQLSSSSDAV